MAEKSDANKRNSRKKNKKKYRKRRLYVALLCFMLLCLFTGIGGYKLYGFLAKLSESSKKSNITPAAVKKDEPVNILVMGVDIGSAGSTNKNDPKRTDTIMLMHYEPKTKKINMISIPRDTLITIKGKKEKINAAHAIGGVPYLIDAVEQLLDIKVNYYGKVDYNGFRKLIDAVGGVDMYIANKMDYDDPAQNLHIHFKKGETVHLDGKKAEEFFRWRKNNDNTGFADGDIGRIENQHLFIEKVIEKFKSPSIITKVPNIMKIVPDYAETNMDPEAILRYGWVFANADKDSIKMHTVKGNSEYIGNISYFIYEEKMNTEVLSVLHENGVKESTAVNATKTPEKTTTETLPQLDKKKLSIQVLNATKTTGLAGSFSNEMKQKGFSKVSIGNYKAATTSKTTASKIIVYGLSEKYDEVLKKEFGINKIERVMKKQGNFDIIVVLGDDYN